ncbi:hypothetical protein [Variovorax sp. HJSM1_2]|uniref:hypothetical protein n=1 Tax=Variovorax sp. HJSM1_2 TaxID=3366263 RepID=UPI003BD59C37
MLEPSIDQGEGLRRSMPHVGLRVIPVVSRGESKAEQPLLLQVCLSLQKFGQSVAVLDGTATETEDNPGLSSLLNRGNWLADFQQESAALHIMPARLGLSQLVAQRSTHHSSLQTLTNHLKNYDVAVVYAPAAQLMELMPETASRPLLMVAPFKKSIVNGYQTFKQFLVETNMTPTLVSLVTDAQGSAERRANSAGETLQHCARTFLHMDTEVMTVRSFAVRGKARPNTPKLAMRLLEDSFAVHKAGFRTAAAEPPLQTWPEGWSR